MRTASLVGLLATTGTAAAGIALAQSDVSGGTKDSCVLAKATPTPSPTPKPSGSGKHTPKAKLTVRKSGASNDPYYAKPGSTKWGDVVLKRGAGDGATDCPTE